MKPIYNIPELGRFNCIVLFGRILLIAFLLNSCKKTVQVDPPANQLVAANIFNSDATAIGAITGIYAYMSNTGINNAGGIQSLTLFTGLSSDELALAGNVNNGTAIAYYQNNLAAAASGY